jgi:O-antigen biosynthesis protein
MSNFSIIIVSLNGRNRIDLPLAGLEIDRSLIHEVIVVDNGSTDGLADHVRKRWPWVRLLRAPRNLGFAGGNNLGIEASRGDFVVLLNDDTEPAPGWLEPLKDAFYRNPRLGIAGCQLLYPGNEGRVQHLGGVVHRNGLTDHVGWGEKPREDGELPAMIPVDYATGAALAIRRAVLEEVGILDPGFWPIYFEEVDFCFRARRRGWESATIPASRVVHHESQTTGRLSRGFLEKYHRNRIRFLLKNRRLAEWPRTIKSEVGWIIRHRPWRDLIPCALAWAWLPVQLIDIARNSRREAPLHREP